MEVKVQYFGALREIAGRSEETIKLSAGATVRDLVALIINKYGRAAADYLLTADSGDLRTGFIILVDGRATDVDAVLKPGCTVQVLPPVGGGRRAQGLH